MKRFSSLLLVAIFALFCTALFAVTDLGGTYAVARPNSPYAAEEGDKTIKTLPEGTVIRLIKDETVAEAVILGPFRILKLMIHIEPRGNWLVEDEHGNRGYMWDSDLKLLRPRRSALK